MATYPSGIAAGTLADIGTANLANYMPHIWAKEVLAFVENNLVCADKFNHDYEKDLAGGGDQVVINPLLEVSAAAVNTAAVPTSYDTDQGAPVNLIINFWYEAVVGVNDFQSGRGVPDYETAVIPKLAYEIAKEIDTQVATLFNSFAQTVGANGVAVDYDTLLDAKEYLDLANAPMDGRVLIIDPETLRDLMELDVFINADYGAGGAVSKGFVGQMPTLGCAVYMTTNLPDTYTSYHSATMAHKDAITVAVPDGGVKTATWREEARHTTFHRASAYWGQIELRDTFGVLIHTRS